MRITRWIAATVALGALVASAVPALGADRPATASKQKKPVTVASDFYSPSKVNARVGERVRFKWTPGLELHDVTVERGPQRFHSPLQSSGTWSTPKLKKPGSYLLHCSLHDMSLKLTVKRR
jgi:plastocyanin